MENYLMKEMVVGMKSRGRQKTRMTNAIKEELGLTITEGIKRFRTGRNETTLGMLPQLLRKPNFLKDSNGSINKAFTSLDLK